MQYVIKAKNVTGVVSALACISIKEDSVDCVSSLDIIQNPSIARALRAQGVTFSWKFLKLPQVGDKAFLVDLMPEYEKDCAFKEIDLATAINDVKSIAAALYNNPEIDWAHNQSEAVSGVAQAIYSGVLSIANMSKYGQLVPVFTGTGKLGDKNIMMTVDPRIRANAVMEDPTEKLSFRVPLYEELLKIYKVNDSKEDEEDTEIPASTGETSEFTSELGNIFTYESVGPILSPKLIRVDKITEYYDSFYIRDINTMVNNFDLEDITGHVQNNMLPIQDNEKEYFEQLKSLVDDGLRCENQVLSDSAVKALIADGKRSAIVDSYLKDLAEYAYDLTRSHTGYVSTDKFVVDKDSDDDDDDEVSEEYAQEVAGFYRIERIPGTSKFKKKGITLNEAEALLNDALRNVGQGWSRLTAFMSNFVVNSYGWVEAAVKLMRWGSRKPVILFVDGAKKDGNPVYFNLENTEYTGFNGDIRNIPTKIYDNGSKYKIMGLIVAEGTMEDTEALKNATKITRELNYDTVISFPIGVVLQTGFENTDYTVNEFCDIFQLMKDLQAGKNIGGLRMENEHIVDNSGSEEWMNNRFTIAAVISSLMESDDRNLVRANSILYRYINQAIKINGNSIVIKQGVMNLFKIASLMFMTNDISREFTLGTTYTLDDVNHRLEYKQQMRDLYGEENATPMRLTESYLVRTFVPVFMRLWDQGAETARDMDTLHTYTEVALTALEEEAENDAQNAAVSKEFLKGYENVAGIVTIVDNGQTIGYIGVDRNKIKYIFAPDEVKIREGVAKGPTLSKEEFVDKCYNAYRQAVNSRNKDILDRFYSRIKVATNKTMGRIRGE